MYRHFSNGHIPPPQNTEPPPEPTTQMPKMRKVLYTLSILHSTIQHIQQLYRGGVDKKTSKGLRNIITISWRCLVLFSEAHRTV